MFVDSARLTIKSGKGGDGCVSFRREKYVPAGGPDGGDGGSGGDVIFVTDPSLNTLVNFRHKRKLSAADGKQGSGRNKSGAKGEDLIISVPRGTIIREAASGKIIHDMSASDEKFILLKGGRGGKGNQHYATAVMQAPKYAQPGGEALEIEVILELKVIADVGLIGFPSVGKSTLLSIISNAKPKIAAYHFTTLSPNLGVVDLDDGAGFVVADIPGLIEGAAEGAGLGHEFLKHIERTKVLVHIVDASSIEGRNPSEDIKIINSELNEFNPLLSEKPQIIAANKIDLIYDENEKKKIISEIKACCSESTPVMPISAATGEGIKDLLYLTYDLVKKSRSDTVTYESELSVDEINFDKNLPFEIELTKDGVFNVTGPRIERMLGYTNLESEKGFMFFQNFMKEQGIIDEMLKLGLKEKDTVKVYGYEFEYYE